MPETIEHIVARPSSRKRETPIFFQHGLCHGAWCWHLFMEYFSSLGYEVHAISVPGHGKSSLEKGHINKYGIRDYMDCMVEKIEELSPPPVIVGHSLGGMMALKYLEDCNLPAAVLMSSTPHNGVLPLIGRLLMKRPLRALRVPLAWDLSVDEPEIARILFLGEDTDIDMKEFMDNLRADSMKVGMEMVFTVRPQTSKIKAPVFVMAGEKDFCFSVAEERRLAEKLGAKFAVMPGQAHDIMLEPRWKDAADAIHEWIAGDLKLP